MKCYVPIKRTWIRKKARRRKELWRTGRVMEDAAGMAVLREAAFALSKGICKICKLAAPWQEEISPAPWPYGELIHKKGRSQGGSDTIDNVEWGHHKCHMERDHPGPQWSPLIRGKV